jgi:hypothetical protein
MFKRKKEDEIYMKEQNFTIWLNSVRLDLYREVRKACLPSILKDRLMTAISDMSLLNVTESSLLVDCGRLDGGRIRATNKIVVCKRNRRLLLHELVHSVQGTEYDAEMVELRVLPNEATPPTPDDYVKFKAEGTKYF